MTMTDNTTYPAHNHAPLVIPRDDYDGDLWSEILPGLWMGGTPMADELGASRDLPFITSTLFQTVITLYSHAQPVDYYVKEIRLGFFDHDQMDVDLADLGHAVHVGHSDWVTGRRVLVRCQAGWNRSGLVTALIMMRSGLEAEETIDVIRRRRSTFALGNTTFEQWLKDEGPGFLDTLPRFSSQGKKRR
jgi:hypothetical protein